MLSKLLKYEFKSSARIFGIIYLVILGLCVSTGLLNRRDVAPTNPVQSALDTTGTLFLATTVLFFCAAVVITTVVLIKRYYQGVYKDEGYLLHTLPVRPWEILAGKLIPALVWTAATTAVMGASGLLMVALINVPMAQNLVTELVESLTVMAEVYGGWGNVVLLVLGILFGMIASVQQVYLAISMGQLVHRHRAGMAVLFWFAINTAENQISLLLGGSLLMGLLMGYHTYDNFSATGFFAASLAFDLVRCVVFWVVTQWLLTKKLNLE